MHANVCVSVFAANISCNHACNHSNSRMKNLKPLSHIENIGVTLVNVWKIDKFLLLHSTRAPNMFVSCVLILSRENERVRERENAPISNICMRKYYHSDPILQFKSVVIFFDRKKNIRTVGSIHRFIAYILQCFPHKAEPFFMPYRVEIEYLKKKKIEKKVNICPYTIQTNLELMI